MHDRPLGWRGWPLNRITGSSAIGLLVALTAGGCSWFGSSEETVDRRCPPALLLDGADRVVTYAPGRERVGSAVRYIAAISSLETDCRQAEEGLEVELRFVVAAEAGPAFDGGPVVLDLFVAAVADGRLAGRQSLDVPLDLAGVGSRVRRLEALTIGMTGPRRGERIYLGLELDPESVQERLQRRRR